jgi:beta-lactamase regulating signal transducer with metallopeptidase domain
MSEFFVNPMVSPAISVALKVSLVFTIAAVIHLAMPRASAAMRHLVLTIGIVGALALPPLSLITPAWPVITRTVAPPATVTAVAATESSTVLPVSGHDLITTEVAATSITPSSAMMPRAQLWLALAYVVGVLVMVIGFVTERWSVRQLARQGTEIVDADWTRLFDECATRLGLSRPVRLIRSRDSNMPMAFGTRRPTILVPAIADMWPDDRRRAVLLHEMAHVCRFDCLTQSLAFLMCTMYWFHPAAWWIARRLRIERELACDDRVIAAGAPPRDYAGHLLEIAYAFGRHQAPALAVSMARPRHLEGRMLAVLDEERNRSVPKRRARVAAALVACALLVPVASATTHQDAVSEPVVAEVSPSITQPAAGPTLKEWKSPVTIVVETAKRVVAATAGLVQDLLPGTWEIRPTRTEGVVHLQLKELNSSSGSNVALKQLEGLTPAQLAGDRGTVQFRLRRDAGTFNFEGVIRKGIGAGTFTFSANPAFVAELAKRGFARPTPLEQYKLARADVGYAFLDELARQGYVKPDIAEIVRAGDHGVNGEYLREMGALGYRLGRLAPLITLRDHGVTPSYVQGLAKHGYTGLTADELRRARDHGVTPDYVQGMRDGGHRSLTMEQLVRARDHGVDPKYVGELGELGYRDLTLEALIRARDHGVDPTFTRGLTSLGYTNLPVETLIRLRDHGVTPEYAGELRKLGYDNVPVDDLVMLRDHGFDADRIRDANTRAGTRLPLDLLKNLARGRQF